MGMLIRYIYHDCFTVETPQCILIFDFWKKPESFPITAVSGDLTSPFNEEQMHKPLYVFVSHFHKDHYNPVVFEWQQIWRRAGYADVHYFISTDVRRHARHILMPDSLYKGYHPEPQTVTVMRKGDTYKDDILSIESFGSTDIGNSYMVETGGKRIFHAGDLNAWIWKDESTEEEVEMALKGFTSELLPVVRNFPTADLSFFPVDSRIGSEYFTGAKIFLERIMTRYFFPMHFTLGESDSEKKRLISDALNFELYLPQGSETVIVGLTSPGDSIRIPD